MFIIEPEISQKQKVMIEKTKASLGMIPPHWELFIKLNPVRFEMFMKEINYLKSHPHINPDFFAFIRLFIANKENFFYCKSMNTKLLLVQGYEKKDLQNFKEDVKALPLDERHQLLMQKVLKSLYKSKEFNANDIEALKAISWTDSDIFDAIDHGAFLFKFSRILKAYLV